MVNESMSMWGSLSVTLGSTGLRLAASALLVAACQSGGAGASASATSTGADTEAEEDDRVVVTHSFGQLALAGYSDTQRCVQWTVDNDQHLYVQSVLLANNGALHHSNWYVVPEDAFPGEDGYFPCDERDFTDLGAALSGSVLFAQSTQSFTDDQRFMEGAVVKVPARHKVMATVHTVNASPRAIETELRMSFELKHPSEVQTVVTPISAQYKELEIPPNARSRFTSRCDWGTSYYAAVGEKPDLKVHYILPHYHYLGERFEVRVVGGERDGELIYSLDGFNADANGKTFDPPLELPGATGFEYTCGYNNWTNKTITWGNGDGEMCVMFILGESEAMLGGTVLSDSTAVGVVDGVVEYEAPCFDIAQAKAPGQGMPTPEEIAAPLYVPPVDPADQGLPSVPPCYDSDPQAAPEQPVTLDSVSKSIFAPSCTFSSCHGEIAAAGLDLSLTGAALRDELLGHTVRADTSMPLIAPGDPEGSWLYRVVSRCEPTDDAGKAVSHMPINAPFLMDDVLIAKLRAWIEAGAPNN
jgi:hypothetical protein